MTAFVYSFIKAPCQLSAFDLQLNTRQQLGEMLRDEGIRWSRFPFTGDIVHCGTSRYHHRHLGEPVSNLTLIRTQSIAHYTIPADGRN